MKYANDIEGMDKETGLPIARGYCVYDWPCPHCGNDRYESDCDKSGMQHKCRSCKKKYVLGGGNL